MSWAPLDSQEGFGQLPITVVVSGCALGLGAKMSDLP